MGDSTTSHPRHPLTETALGSAQDYKSSDISRKTRIIWNSGYPGPAQVRFGSDIVTGTLTVDTPADRRPTDLLEQIVGKGLLALTVDALLHLGVPLDQVVSS